MNNSINSGSLQGLQAGQTLLFQARKVANGKIQLEFAEVVSNGPASVNPLGLFNKSDDRFSSGGARRAWLTAEPKDASIYLGIDLTESNPSWTINQMGQETLELNILNPVAIINGEAIVLKVQVTETTEPTDWQASNISQSAKRRGKNGDFITHQGMYIFANTQVVFREAKHTFLEPDAVKKTAGGIPAGVSGLNLSTGEIFS